VPPSEKQSESQWEWQKQKKHHQEGKKKKSKEGGRAIGDKNVIIYTPRSAITRKLRLQNREENEGLEKGHEDVEHSRRIPTCRKEGATAPVKKGNGLEKSKRKKEKKKLQGRRKGQ